MDIIDIFVYVCRQRFNPFRDNCPNLLQAIEYKLHNHPREFPFHIKPQILIIDEDKALSAKVMHCILDALKVNVKLVSSHPHGSLKTERYINNLITR